MAGETGIHYVSRDNFVKEINIYNNSGTLLIKFDRESLSELIIDKDDDIIIIIGYNKNVLHSLSRYIFEDFKKENENLYFKTEIVYLENQDGNNMVKRFERCLCNNFSNININDNSSEKNIYNMFNLIIKNEKKLSFSDKTFLALKSCFYMLLGVTTIIAFIPLTAISSGISWGMLPFVFSALAAVSDEAKNLSYIASGQDYKVGSNNYVENFFMTMGESIGGLIDSVLNSSSNLAMDGEEKAGKAYQIFRITETFLGLFSGKLASRKLVGKKLGEIESKIYKFSQKPFTELSKGKAKFIDDAIGKASYGVGSQTIFSAINNITSVLKTIERLNNMNIKEINSKRFGKIDISFRGEYLGEIYQSIVENVDIIDFDYSFLSYRRNKKEYKEIEERTVFINLRSFYSDDIDKKYEFIRFFDLFRGMEQGNNTFSMEITNTLEGEVSNFNRKITLDDIVIHNLNENISSNNFSLSMKINKNNRNNIVYEEGEV